MNLAETYTRVRRAIVAFGSKVADSSGGSPPSFPPILGTGFFVHDDGIVVTNRHVIDALDALPPHPEKGQTSSCAFVFSEARSESGATVMGAAIVDVLTSHAVTTFSPPPNYYGQDIPDLGFVRLNVRAVPVLPLNITRNTIASGLEIATAGFPLGDVALTPFGHLSQVTPYLRRGIVSSVFPFPCPTPHGFSIDVASQGGASGSPVFLCDPPEAIGIVHAGFPGTNITFCVPSSIIQISLESYLRQHPPNSEGIPTFEDYAKHGGPPGPMWRSARPT